MMMTSKAFQPFLRAASNSQSKGNRPPPLVPEHAEFFNITISGFSFNYLSSLLNTKLDSTAMLNDFALSSNIRILDFSPIVDRCGAVVENGLDTLGNGM